MTTTAIWRGQDAEGRRAITIAELPDADRCTLIISGRGDEPSTALVLTKAALADLAETLLTLGAEVEC